MNYELRAGTGTGTGTRIVCSVLPKIDEQINLTASARATSSTAADEGEEEEGAEEVEAGVEREDGEKWAAHERAP